jgi:hypothetical protein
MGITKIPFKFGSNKLFEKRGWNFFNLIAWMLKIWEQGQYFVVSKFFAICTSHLAFFIFQSDEGFGIVNVMSWYEVDMVRVEEKTSVLHKGITKEGYEGKS